ncbi:MAG: ABC transporter substrate-binding protein [Actinomycetota bacterium]
MRRRPWFVALAVLAVFSLVAAACGDDDATTTTAAPTTTAATTTTAGPTTTAATTTTEAPAEIAFDTGVTLEPCPDSTNPENGCIYLGNISDFSGPFGLFGQPLAAGHLDFWARVNAEGGIGPDGGQKFDVAITEDNTVDAGYVAEQHVAGYEQIRGNIAALAETLGTLQTLAALPLYVEDSTIGAVSTWYSGWSFPDLDGGVIMETGTNYCMEAMNGFDFMVGLQAQQFEKTTFTYGIVKFPGDYGEDYANGVKYAAAQYGLGEPLAEQLQIPLSAGGTLDDAVIAMATTKPDVIFVATGPQELATLIGGLYGAGHQTALYVGVGPSWNVALLGTAVRPLLEAGVYFHTSPWGPWNSDTAGHAAMRAAADAAGRDPATLGIGYIAGWAMEYNIKAALEQAIANGDLTRAGILAAAGQLTAVDNEGMLPAKSFVGTPAETVERGSLVNRVDTTAVDGLSVLAPFFVGPTAAGYDFSAPCAILGG